MYFFSFLRPNRCFSADSQYGSKQNFILEGDFTDSQFVSSCLESIFIWLVLVVEGLEPHSKKGCTGPFWVEFARPPHVCVGLLQVLPFPPPLAGIQVTVLNGS